MNAIEIAETRKLDRGRGALIVTLTAGEMQETHTIYLLQPGGCAVCGKRETIGNGSQVDAIVAERKDRMRERLQYLESLIEAK